VRFALVALLLLLPSTALAEEPKGFADFKWGTDRATIDEQILKSKCTWPGGWADYDNPRPMCMDYQLPGIGPAMIGLDLTDRTLQGYSVTVPLAKSRDFAQGLEAKFGKPKLRQPLKEGGSAYTWEWPSGTTAIYLERTPLGGMLTVTTKTALDRTGKQIRERNEKIRKGF